MNAIERDTRPWYLKNRGPGFPEDPPRPLWGNDVIRLKCCPDCGGKGYFVINPLHSGSCEAANGPGNMTQCLTCLRSKTYFDRHGTLPEELRGAVEKWEKEQANG